MAALKVTSSTGFTSTKLIARAQYPGLRVPHGIPANEPIAVPFSRMSQLAPNKFPAPAGLTVLEKRSVSLAGPWKQVAGTTPPRWQFQGGELKLEVELGVYIIDKYQPIPKLFEVIMTHELMHVQDSYDILGTFLPKELVKDDNIKKYLVDQAEVDDSAYRYWFTGDKLKEYVTTIWTEEWNKRGKARDSGPLYERYKQDVAKLLPTI